MEILIMAAIVILFVGSVFLSVLFFVRSGKIFANRVMKGFVTVAKIRREYYRHGYNKNAEYSLIYVDESEEGIKRNNFLGEEHTVRKHLGDALLKIAEWGEGNYVAPYKNGGYLILSQNNKEGIEKRISALNKEMHTFINKKEIVGDLMIFFGIYYRPSNDIDFDEAVERARMAYRNAEKREAELEFWDYNMHKEISESDALKKIIQKEVEENHFYLEWQPIVDITTGKIVCAEILSRLNSEERGIVPPGKFVPIITELDLCEKFDFYIFEKACKWLSSRLKMGKNHIGISVNFFRATLASRNFTSRITKLIEKYEIPAGVLRIEILEENLKLSQSDADLEKNLNSLRDLGVLVMLDDFGAGYTSFADISHYPIDIVKIDREIMKNSTDPVGKAIFHNIVNIAREIGAWIICEGVDSEEQIEVIKEAECKFVQGYYFYKPMSITEFEKLLEDNK